MKGLSIEIPEKKRIALVAHDNKKQELMEWVEDNKSILVQHELLGTGTTGKLLEESLGVQLTKLESGPLGGDLQIGAKVASGEIDILVFFWDPLEPHPHDPDVKALLRIAVVWNIPLACDRATADFLLHSPWMGKIYQRHIQDFNEYRGRLKTEKSESKNS